jgi:chaperonin cofactor prefoldin
MKRKPQAESLTSTFSKSANKIAQLVHEIESQAIAAQQQISLVRTQLAGKQREMRLAQLTKSEISSLPPTTSIYEGVGKMFASSAVLRI